MGRNREESEEEKKRLKIMKGRNKFALIGNNDFYQNIQGKCII